MTTAAATPTSASSSSNSSNSKSIPSGYSRAWLFFTNFVTMAAWARVLFVVVSNGWPTLSDPDSNQVCLDNLNPAVRTALLVSFLETFNCLIGITRSPIAAVLLFSLTRMGVDYWVAPVIPCGSWQHLLTVTSWAMGDSVRFGCFALDSAIPGIHAIKSVRFTVGPIMFPIGAFAEMMMVVLAATIKDHHKLIYFAASLWPFFFYPMMQQLLKQRRKHFQSKDKKKVIKSV